MRGKYKLVAVDLDDTLLAEDLSITGRVKEAVKAVRAKGVHITVSTGRMYRSAARIAGELGIEIPLITYQGALVKNSLSGEVLVYRPLPLDCARELIARVHQLGYPINGYLDDRLLVERETPESRRYVSISGVQAEVVGDLLHYLDRDPTKILAIAKEPLIDQLAAELIPLYRGRAHISKSKPHFLEFSHTQATKGQALAFLADYFGVQREEVMALGDSYNDLDMLEYAGLGVVVANARDEIKEKADYVTSASYGDGVVEALEKFVLIGS
ncbi:Cof-type HAD-IIB family hydrolase [Pelotomaculum propionicicum]|uniref:Sugar phosphatase YidA n=1 Tax=Pelotomaculum propionicicum TaxID=258475 RepID=A0A4Y7RMY0_9FIRM|nr:Cof-type HAD-IIB family hydrolase [Pelotomaculum propionicicum]TEB10110.1 Sugar phosphatase YidA [Pelotomaculum propionicicum]